MQLADLIETAVVAQRIKMLADVRLEHVEMPIDQLGGAERHLIGEMNTPAMCLDRLALRMILPVTSPSGF